MSYYSRNETNQIVFDLVALRKLSLFVATPAYDDKVTSGYCEATAKLSAISAKHGLNISLNLLRGCSSIIVARNLLAAHFLRSQASHFLFIDSDITFSADDAIRMLAMDLDVLGGVYPRKLYDFTKIIAAAKLGDPEPVSAGLQGTTEPVENPVEVDMAVEVARLPAGFLMIKREVFTKLLASGLAPKWDPGSKVGDIDALTYGFFESPIENGHLTGEDWNFCDKWRTIGGKCFADRVAVLRHDGFSYFQSSPDRLLLS